MSTQRTSAPRPRLAPPGSCDNPEPDQAAPTRPVSHRAPASPSRIDRNLILIAAGVAAVIIAIVGMFVLAATRPAHAAGVPAVVSTASEGQACRYEGATYHEEGRTFLCQKIKNCLCWHKVDYPCHWCLPSRSPSPSPTGTPATSPSATSTTTKSASPSAAEPSEPAGPSGTPAVPPDEPTLPNTGSPAKRLTILGAAVIALGAILVAARRRRVREEDDEAYDQA